jgi:hypothetical protein
MANAGGALAARLGQPQKTQSVWPKNQAGHLLAIHGLICQKKITGFFVGLLRKKCFLLDWLFFS